MMSQNNKLEILTWYESKYRRKVSGESHTENEKGGWSTYKFFMMKQTNRQVF